MTNNIEIVNAAVTLIIKAALLAARFSGRARKRSLKRLSKMDVDEKDKEILFLRDKVDQQQMQITILQKGLQKKHTNKRYTLREKCSSSLTWKSFRFPDAESPNIWALPNQRSTDGCIRSKNRQPSRIPANKTPAEIAALVWEITKANVSWGRVRIANQGLII